MAGKTLTIERIFDAPVERVWQVWTNPEEIKKWWGPKDFTAPSVKVDFKEGGKYLYAMHGPAGTEWDIDTYSGGTFKEIVPHQRIVMTDSFMDKDGNIVSADVYGMPADWPREQRITVTFESIDDGKKTKLTIFHDDFPEGQVSGANEGWNQSLDKLAATL